MELIDSARYFAALLLTFGLLLLAWWAVRRFAPGMVRIKPTGEKRLSISEALHLDPRRRVIVLRDGTREHVVLLGLAGETVLESRDMPPQEITP